MSQGCPKFSKKKKTWVSGRVIAECNGWIAQYLMVIETSILRPERNEEREVELIPNPSPPKKKLQG
jgi:hypothetical protein